MLFGFTVMGMLAVRTYTDSMPQPERVVDPTGEEVFSGNDITAGQQIFLVAACSSTAPSWGTAAISGRTGRLTTCAALPSSYILN